MKSMLSVSAVFLMAVSVVSGNSPAPDSPMRRAVEEALEYSSMRCLTVCRDSCMTALSWQAEGISPGTLWYLYEYSMNPDILEAAVEVTDGILDGRCIPHAHDVCLTINGSYGNAYRLTGRETYRNAVIDAAASVIDSTGPVIGNVMSLELLTMASALSGDNTAYRMAEQYADKAMMCPSDPACGLYGFTMMYRQTNDRKYLEQAVSLGRSVMKHAFLPKDGIPYRTPGIVGDGLSGRDPSAGAVMASAFIELSTYVDGELSERFLDVAERQIRSLMSPAYSDTVWNDYYYVEALMRYRRLLDGHRVADAFTALSENDDRAFWLSALRHICAPVLENMAKGELKKNMPVEAKAGKVEYRTRVTHLEAFGRLMTGISPWLELGEDDTPEGRLRGKYIHLAVQCIENAVDPESPDYLNFNKEKQPLVDAAFLAHGLLRSKGQVWSRLDTLTRARLIAELKSTRLIEPWENNWLLFSAMVECAIKEFSGDWEYERVQYALDKFVKWYKGDGWYGDGSKFHLDYYNSFVIHPMLTQILEITAKYGKTDRELYETQCKRYRRYAVQLERMISPDGTYPALGRSLAYRFGAFHALSDVAYRDMLPSDVSPSQVRCALIEVLRNQTGPGTFDENGWLRIGFCGHQPQIGEAYISTGSLYLCTAVFVALGLPPDDIFWSAPAADWTGKKIWKGVDMACDKAL